jgi:hypothetical protein
MSERFEATMTCNECGKGSPLDLEASDASDPRCSICGAFQMKTPQVIGYGESLADWLERLPIPADELTRMRDMVARFFWLGERRGVVFSSSGIGTATISGLSEAQLRALAPAVRRAVAVMGNVGAR